MTRPSKLRKKKIGKSLYWFTKAGGETYFGNVKSVPYDQAKKLYASHIKKVAEEEQASKGKELTAGELIDLFLDWLHKHRSGQTYNTRRTYCSRFASFRVGSKRIADLPANRIKSSDMEDWLDQLAGQGLDPQTRRHAQTSVKHCWNWSTKHPSPTPYLPPTYRPFASVLSRYFGVGIALEPNADNRMANDRIYIPVQMNGKLMGWQARLTYDVPKTDKNAPPKYIFNRGFPRSQVLYNFDSAKRWPFVVVVEGATKVWRFGPEAVGTFGKCVTGYQAALLQNHWEKIIIVLDPNALEESKVLLKILQARKQVALVQLPEGLEPDEMETPALRQLVRDEAQRQGMVFP